MELVLSHVSDGLFSVRNALFSSLELLWMSLNLLTSSCEMDMSILVSVSPEKLVVPVPGEVVVLRVDWINVGFVVHERL